MNGLLSSPGVTREIQMNDVQELSFSGKTIRRRMSGSSGWTIILCHDYESAFQKLKSRVKERVEFCPRTAASARQRPRWNG
jgi:hypothetical protein